MRVDAVRNREHIADIARQLFREKSFDAVSMDEVAKMAGVGTGTLYRHFPTKEFLYDAATQAWMETVSAAVEKALSGEGTPRDRLLSSFSACVEGLTRHKGAASRITSALGDEGSPFVTQCRAYLQANQRVIDTLASEGVLRHDVEALQLCRLVGGVAAVVDNSELTPEIVRSMLAVVADGVLDG